MGSIHLSCDLALQSRLSKLRDAIVIHFNITVLVCQDKQGNNQTIELSTRLVVSKPILVTWYTMSHLSQHLSTIACFQHTFQHPCPIPYPPGGFSEQQQQ